jgi:hypothetical protein
MDSLILKTPSQQTSKISLFQNKSFCPTAMVL